ncbi:MAG: type I-C CRISPR-associated protein Cas5c [Oscillospiraceae bacterium]
MTFQNTIELEIYGGSAMFTDPEQKAEGRLCSLPVPTYEAVKGILRSVYWKPTFIWVPDELRIMHKITTERYPVKLYRDGKVILTEKQRLCNVRYQLRAHFVWNDNRPELACDRDENKHFHIALRSLSRGGRRSVFLGTSDCTGYVRPARFGSGRGFYDGCDKDFGVMYHGITYPDENFADPQCMDVFQRSFRCVMTDGIIKFPPPEECQSEFLRHGAVKWFGDIPLTV